MLLLVTIRGILPSRVTMAPAYVEATIAVHETKNGGAGDICREDKYYEQTEVPPRHDNIQSKNFRVLRITELWGCKKLDNGSKWKTLPIVRSWDSRGRSSRTVWMG